MPTRPQIAALLVVAGIAWGVALILSGTTVSWAHAAPFGTAVSAVGLAATVFNRWAWRWPIAYGWLSKQPDLRGTWRVLLDSEWEDPVTRRRIGPITAYMGIEQTYSKITMHLMTSESESWLTAHCIETSKKTTTGYTVVGVYHNKPKPELRTGRSPMHFGTLSVDTHGPEQRPTSMAGEYWTDRKTKGTIALADRRAEVITRYEDAHRAFDDGDGVAHAG
ncbi:hypothetical protein KF840_17495 [bacterium]|nr:hypothetical protein [bacterium]